MASQVSSDQPTPTDENPQPRSGLTPRHCIAICLLVLCRFLPTMVRTLRGYFIDQSPTQWEHYTASILCPLLGLSLATGFHMVLQSAFPSLNPTADPAPQALPRRCHVILWISAAVLYVTAAHIEWLEHESEVLADGEVAQVEKYHFIAFAFGYAGLAAVYLRKQLGLE